MVGIVGYRGCYRVGERQENQVWGKEGWEGLFSGGGGGEGRAGAVGDTIPCLSPYHSRKVGMWKGA